MNYHAIIKNGDGKKQFYRNGHLSWYKENIIVPLFNNQVVVLHDWGGAGREAVVNMSSVMEVTLFKTEEKLEGEWKDISSTILDDSFQKYNCTNEVLNEVKSELSSEGAKSLLQKTFSTIKDQVFVVMKFGDEELDSAYEGVIEPLIIENELTPIRVDKIQDAGKISDQILENIASSKIVISDLSGERPNCYYETGFAHALGKELILTIRESDKIHFDLSGYRFIVWKTEADLRKQLRERLAALLENT
ncbi:hypothetical protein L1D29_03260 [Shewanella insulae]|uniref:hypothetical protein n=1 Tax=Shewanella insulae TaxID=2681496 RepID=UPI001EFCD7C9|nr:hypothetical protein [Shewanella insulae]MCG9711837.1 hypothetical protein [Shewanella insulae]